MYLDIENIINMQQNNDIANDDDGDDNNITIGWQVPV